MNTPHIDAIWAQWHQHHRETHHHQLAVHYLPHARQIADRYTHLPPDVSNDDLAQEAGIALLRAITNYNPDRGPFVPHATASIRQALNDYLRAHKWMKRQQQDQLKAVENAIAVLYMTLNREPTNTEVADYLNHYTHNPTTDTPEPRYVNGSRFLPAPNNKGWSPQHVAEALHHHTAAATTSLDDLLNEPAHPDQQTPEEAVVSSHDVSIRDHITQLTPQARVVIALYYIENLTLDDIATVLHVTPGRVSQIHKKALIALREHLNPPT